MASTITAKEPAEIPTLREIETAFKQIDSKKERLKKAYDDLQAHSSLLSSSALSSLSWSDLDAHFTHIQAQLTRRFHLLHSLYPTTTTTTPGSPGLVESVVTPPEAVTTSQEKSPPRNQGEAAVAVGPPPSSSLGGGGPVSVELMSLCLEMDGKGLREYMNERGEEREAVREELVSALRVVPDAGTLVLNAMGEFFGLSSKLKRVCFDLLEVVVEIRPNLSDEAKERAKKLALEWKGKVSVKGENTSDALGFLGLVAAFGLLSEFDAGELVDYLVLAARNDQAAALCRTIDLGDKMSDVIQKLVDGGKQLVAVKFIIESGLTDKFPPVPILKAYLKETKKVANRVCSEGNNSIKAQNDAKSREISALKLVLKIVDEYKLETQYPRVGLEKRIDMLKRQKAERKRPASFAENTPQQQQQGKKQPPPNGNKRPRTDSGSGSAIRPSQQHYLEPGGLLPTAGPYRLVGSTPPIAHYAGSSAGPYNYAGAATGLPGNPGHAPAHLYPSESYMPSVYSPAAYGVYGLPQYHPTYYQQ